MAQIPNLDNAPLNLAALRYLVMIPTHLLTLVFVPVNFNLYV